MKKVWFTIWVGVALTSSLSKPAHAIEQYYLETGAGISQMRSGALIFGSAPQVMGFGAAVNVTGAVNLSSVGSKAQAHIGLQYRYTTITENSASYSLHAPYLILRLQASRLFVTLGATPWIWSSLTDGTGSKSFTKSDISYSALGELGFDVPVTPEVSLIFAAGNQLISVNSHYVWAHDVWGGFRFFIGKTSGSGASASSGSRGKFTGWRYPWGRAK